MLQRSLEGAGVTGEVTLHKRTGNPSWERSVPSFSWGNTQIKKELKGEARITKLWDYREAFKDCPKIVFWATSLSSYEKKFQAVGNE